MFLYDGSNGGYIYRLMTALDEAIREIEAAA
jgi:hypothetical protein